ncbi:type II TA system antitoxin MqsA family protein [Mitsuaria sp. 7]|uniref:type II TA system antitoxin MqsA family protein n=1 Tax=Mitsuaria sp. 7 TaxID=1658665 RepID=UPI0009ED517D|nr:type II TA system antitoxin MqsA family protein [Mitsuaria sp. 7]
MTDRNKPVCPNCGSTRLKSMVFEETYRPRGAEVVVKLLGTKCAACGHEAGTWSQHDENMRRLAARKSFYDGLLMGEEIVALRKRYGLTQQAAARIFGKGKIAFSRYENEASYPDDSTTLMLQAAIEMPRFIKWLADKAGVELPLWRQRMRDDAAARRALRLAAEAATPAKASSALKNPRGKAAKTARAPAHAHA